MRLDGRSVAAFTQHPSYLFARSFSVQQTPTHRLTVLIYRSKLKRKFAFHLLLGKCTRSYAYLHEPPVLHGNEHVHASFRTLTKCINTDTVESMERASRRALSPAFVLTSFRPDFTWYSAGWWNAQCGPILAFRWMKFASFDCRQYLSPNVRHYLLYRF